MSWKLNWGETKMKKKHPQRKGIKLKMYICHSRCVLCFIWRIIAFLCLLVIENEPLSISFQFCEIETSSVWIHWWSRGDHLRFNRNYLVSSLRFLFCFVFVNVDINADANALLASRRCQVTMMVCIFVSSPRHSFQSQFYFTAFESIAHVISRRHIVETFLSPTN